MFRSITPVLALIPLCASIQASESLTVDSSYDTRHRESLVNQHERNASEASSEGSRSPRAVRLQAKDKHSFEVFGTGTVGVLAAQKKVPRRRLPRSIGQLKQVAGVPAAWPLNGNFEVGTTGQPPDFWVRDGNTVNGCTPGHISNDAHNGAKSMELGPKGCLLTGWDPRSMFAVDAGKEYTLKFWSKTTGAAEWATFFNVYSTDSNTSTHIQLKTVTGFGAAAGQTIAQKMFTETGPNGWIEKEHRFIAAETSERVRLTVASNTGTVLIDDMTFTLDCPTRISVGGNLTAIPSASPLLGTYVKDPLRSKSGQAVYKLENTGVTPQRYMYFWDDTQQWVIGKDFTTLTDSELQSVQVDPDNCPDSSGGSWSVWDTARWQVRSVTVDNVMVMSLMGAGGLHA